MIEILLISFVILYLLWIFYLAVMNLAMAKRAGKLSKLALIMGMPVLIIGYVLDFLANIILTIPFLDIPRETTVTARLTRYKFGKDGWRKSFAIRFADDMLDDFDPTGSHLR